MKKMMLCVLAVCAISAAASAQEVSTYTFERKVSPDRAPQVLLDKMKVEQARVAVFARTTPNAPYSAEATTESVMALADGNRIARKTTTRVYRDSAGRTRQETVGPDGQVTTIMISDLVAKTGYVLDPRTQSAKLLMAYYTVTHSDLEPATVGTVLPTTLSQAGGAMTWTAASSGGGGQPQHLQKTIVVTAGESGVFKIESGHATMEEATKEDLGEQTIEGVVAKGTRTTTVIPAGAVDNEQPIRIVSEEWFSPELQVLVLTKHADPRVGETTYRLMNISRTEPAKSLFELPAGYTVKTPDGESQMQIIKK